MSRNIRGTPYKFVICVHEKRENFDLTGVQLANFAIFVLYMVSIHKKYSKAKVFIFVGVNESLEKLLKADSKRLFGSSGHHMIIFKAIHRTQKPLYFSVVSLKVLTNIQEFMVFVFFALPSIWTIFWSFTQERELCDTSSYALESSFSLYQAL